MPHLHGGFYPEDGGSLLQKNYWDVSVVQFTLLVRICRTVHIIGTYLSYSSHYWYVSVVQFTFCETAILNFTAVRTSDLVKEEIILCHNIQYKPG